MRRAELDFVGCHRCAPGHECGLDHSLELVNGEHVDALTVDVDRRDRAQREPGDVSIPGEGGREHAGYVREAGRADLLVPVQAVALPVVELPVEVAGEGERAHEDRNAGRHAEHRAERRRVDPTRREADAETRSEGASDTEAARPAPAPLIRGPTTRRATGHRRDHCRERQDRERARREDKPVDLRAGVETRVACQREQHHRRHQYREPARDHDAGGGDRKGTHEHRGAQLPVVHAQGAKGRVVATVRVRLAREGLRDRECGRRARRVRRRR